MFAVYTCVWAEGLKYEIQQAHLSSPSEKLAQAKEDNLDMHQVLDQTLLELNNL